MGICASSPRTETNQTGTQLPTAILDESATSSASTFNAKRALPAIPPPVIEEVALAPEPTPNMRILLAMYEYQARTDEDLTFHQGERLELLDDSDANWWKARSLTTNQVGFIPCNYVAEESSIEAEPWYHGKLERAEAQRLLTSQPHGSFLVRLSSDGQSYALSIRLIGADIDYKHYRVRKMENGDFFIASRVIKPSITTLINHYQQQADGLCCQLSHPCPKLNEPTLNTLSHKDEWEIPRIQIRLERKLGAGQFGEVWKGRWNNSTDVAVKTLKPGAMSSDEFLSEAAIMKKLRHTNLIQLYAVCTDGEPMYIISELMRYGSLLDYLHEHGRGLTVQQLVDMTAQIASGMAYLEGQNFVHRARNVLVGDNNVCKVGDFGMSRGLENDDIYEAHQGAKFPIKWTAPEAANYNRFSTKSDVWAFGILMMEIITLGRVPYPGMSNAEVLRRVDVPEKYRMPKPQNCPDEYHAIMFACWQHEADDRPLFESLKVQLEDFAYNTDAYA